MEFTIDHLFNHRRHLPAIAEAIYDEFWRDKPGYSPAVFERLLGQASSPDCIPLSLVALVDDRPAGTINLIDDDDASRPHLHPWLAALIVFPEYRRAGIGSALVSQLLEHAARLGHRTVCFGTDSPGFYTRLGAVHTGGISGDISIMRFTNDASPRV